MTTTKIFGPPGTGKTTELLRIMERELREGVPPHRIAYLTFSKDASRVAVERAREQFDYSRQELPWVRTIHSVAYQLLDATRAQLLSSPDDLHPFGQEAVPFADWGRDMPGETEGAQKAQQLLQLDSYRRHVQKPLEDVVREWPLRTWGADDPEEGMGVREEATWFRDQYRRWKDREGVLDFTDLLEQVSQPLPVDVVIVDEAQDLSPLQWQALECYASAAQRVYIAGDDDQAVFTWAGASPQQFKDWPADHERTLDQSYRVPGVVHRLAGELIRRVPDRQPKAWQARPEEGKLREIRGSRLAEIRGMLPHYLDGDDTWLILYRRRKQGQEVARELRRLGIPYAGVDRRSPGGTATPAIIGWEGLRSGETLSHKEVKTVVEALGEKSVAKALEDRGPGFTYDLDALRDLGLEAQGPWFETLRSVPPRERRYLRRVLRHSQGSRATLLGEPRIRLSTMHAAKGDEANYVLLLSELEGRPYQTYENDPAAEIRVFYVGVTRARKGLVLFGSPSSPMFEHIDWSHVRQKGDGT